MSLYYHRNEILKLINRGQWQHSWHLPKDKNGDVDWSSDKTKAEVIRILRDDLDCISRMAYKIRIVLKAVEGGE